MVSRGGAFAPGRDFSIQDVDSSGSGSTVEGGCDGPTGASALATVREVPSSAWPNSYRSRALSYVPLIELESESEA